MDAPRLDAWSLHCLAVFVRERSVTRAGAALGLSQPAASSILAKLRTTFGDPLLVKSASGMVPTPRAMELERQCGRMLHEMRSMLKPESDADPARFEGSVTIAAIDTVRALLWPSLLALLAAEAPDLTVRVHEVDRTRIHALLENGTVDLGIGPRSVSTGRLHYKELWADHPVLMAGRSTIEAGSVVDVEQLCSFPSAVVQTGRPSFYDELLDKALTDIGRHRKVAVVEKSYLLLPLLLERCQLVAVVPAQFGLHAIQRHAVSISDCPIDLAELSIGLYWHEKTHRDPMYRWIRERITSCTPDALKVPDEASKIARTLPVQPGRADGATPAKQRN